MFDLYVTSVDDKPKYLHMHPCQDENFANLLKEHTDENFANLLKEHTAASVSQV